MKINKKYGTWNIDSMNQYCKDENNGYKIFDTKWVIKSYQKQLWALVKCPNNNHNEYWVFWNSFKRGYYCKECYYDNNNLTNWTKDKILDFYQNNNLIICNINDFVNVDKRIKCINKMGYFVYISISGLIHNNLFNCESSIFKHNPMALDNIKLFCIKERPDYEILSTQYLGIKELHLFQYNGIGLKENADKKFWCTIDSFYHGKVQHPYLNKYKAELYIENFLLNNHIKYEPQYTKHNCKNLKTNYTLRFDFVLLDDKNTIKIVIEADGESHTKPIKYWGGEEGLKERQYKDELKNLYCKTNNIPLLRIPYYEFNNIEQILISELSKYDLIGGDYINKSEVNLYNEQGLLASL